MALTIDYVTTLASGTDTASYSLGNASPANDGLLVVVPLSRGTSGATLSSVTIGGSAGTVWATDANGGNVVGIAGRVVSAGSQSIAVDYSASMSRCAAAVYLVRDYQSTTPYDTVTSISTASGTTLAVSLDYPAAGGRAIYGAAGLGTDAISWSAATENYDATTEMRFAFANRAATGAAVSETMTVPFTLAMRMMVGASWEQSTGATSKPWYYMAQQRVVV